MLRDQARGELWRSERVAIDAFFFDRYLVEIEPSMVSACIVFLPFFVFDATTFMTIVRPHPLRTPPNARAQCIKISIPKRDGRTYIHTYIHTDAKRDVKQD